MSPNSLFKKIKKALSLSEKISVTHFLYLWFLSVFGFLAVYVVATDFFTKELNETVFGSSALFSLLFYGFLVLGIGAFGFASLLILLNALNNKKLGKVVRLILLASLLSFASYSLYRIGFQEGERSVVIEYTREDMESICRPLVEEATEEIVLPYCGIRGCPTYQNWNGQSIVYQPTTMTKGGAEIWIIKNNRIVFKSDTEAMLSYRFNEDGITLRYVKEFDDTGLYPKTWEEQKIIYSEDNDKWIVE